MRRRCRTRAGGFFFRVQGKSTSSRPTAAQSCALSRLNSSEWTNEAVSTAINSPLPVLSRRPRNNTAASHNTTPRDVVFLQEYRVLLSFVWKWGNSYPRSDYRSHEPVPGSPWNAEIPFGGIDDLHELNTANYWRELTPGWILRTPARKRSRQIHGSAEWNYFILLLIANINLSLYNVARNSISRHISVPKSMNVHVCTHLYI